MAITIVRLARAAWKNPARSLSWVSFKCKESTHGIVGRYASAAGVRADGFCVSRYGRAQTFASRAGRMRQVNDNRRQRTGAESQSAMSRASYSTTLPRRKRRRRLYICSCSTVGRGRASGSTSRCGRARRIPTELWIQTEDYTRQAAHYMIAEVPFMEPLPCTPGP